MADQGGGAMTDPVRALAERLRMAWVRWARTQPTSKPSWLVPWSELDEQSRSADVALAREALAFVAERLPTREEITGVIARRPTQPYSCHCLYRLGSSGSGTNESWFLDDRCQECFARADALLRDLRERLADAGAGKERGDGV